MIDYYVVEYSINQRCFNIDLLKEIIAKNIGDVIVGNDSTDYKIIGVFKTYQDASDFIEKYKEILIKGFTKE